jgi:hypothetical protein
MSSMWRQIQSHRRASDLSMITCKKYFKLRFVVVWSFATADRDTRHHQFMFETKDGCVDHKVVVCLGVRSKRQGRNEWYDSLKH